MIEVPSYLAHPLAPTIAAKPVSDFQLDMSCYPTWRLESSELNEVLDALWESLELNSENIIGNTNLLPKVASAQLPYCNSFKQADLFICSLPEGLKPTKKLASKDVVPCFMCGAKTELYKMCNQVGSHILCSIKVDDQAESTVEQVGVNPCGFCGRDGCITHITQLKVQACGRGMAITSNCPYPSHYAGMQYKAAAKYTQYTPCTNVPIHCPLCPKALSGDEQTIWKYNVLYHLASEHSIGSTPPEIPG